MSIPKRRLAAPLRILLALLVGLAMTAGLQGPPAQASNASKVKSLISKIVKSKHPKTTWSKMSKKDKALVKKELFNGKVKLKYVTSTTTTNAVPNGSSTTRCWQKSLRAEYYGLFSVRLLFTVTNTTQVCVEGDTVTTAVVVEAWQDTNIIPWHPAGVTQGALDVDWEGRGAVRGRFEFTPTGWTLGTKELCAQLRLNADMVHYSASDKCSVA
jgi:hypothetical protein